MGDRYFNHIVGCLESSIESAEDGITCHISAVTVQGAVDLLKEQEQGWVPVRERLPEERHSVLVYCPEYRNIFCAYYYKDEWLFFGGGCKPIDENVSHWRVLPESPIEDGGDGDG